MSTVQSEAESYPFTWPPPTTGFTLEAVGAPDDNDEAERLNADRVHSLDDDVVIVAWEDATPANDSEIDQVPHDIKSGFLGPHVEYLRVRAVHLDLAYREGVRSLDEAAIKRHTGCTVIGTGLACGYGRVSVPTYTRVQLDDRVNNQGKTRAPAGVTPPPYIPSTVMEDSKDPLFIVEAPIKALSMVSNGFPNTIGCGGVNAGFFAKGSSKIQSDLRPFLHRTRPVYIVFDAGRATNVLVAKAEAKIARALLDGGAPTYVVELPLDPEGKDQGPDDYLAAHGHAAMAALIQQARPASPTEWARAKVKQGAAAARTLLEHVPFVAALVAAGPGEIDAVAKVLKDFTDKRSLREACSAFRKVVREKSESTGASPSSSSLAVGDHVEVGRRYLKGLGASAVYADGAMHSYADGVWTRLDARQQMAAIADFSGTPVDTPSGPRPLKLKDLDCKGILAVAENLTADPDFFHAAPRGLAFKNGFVVLDAAAVVVRDHSPDNRARYAYDFDFKPDTPCPQWDAFMTSLWEGDVDAAEKRDACQEFFGACLLGVAPRFKKCVVMVGDTDSGKSTCLDIMRGTFPPGTTEAIAPGDWTSDYKRASLAGKLLNTVGELPEKEWIETESFKAFVGEDPINARQIYGVPFTYFSLAGHIFAANALPRVSDRSDATWNRMLVLTCNQRFYRTPTAGQKQAQDGLARLILADETPGIIAWALRGAERLVSRRTYTVPSTSSEVVQRWKENSDQLEEFFNDTLEHHKPSNLPTRAVYELYRGWAQATGHKTLASERFREAFILFLRRKTGEQDPKYKSHGISVYRAIRQRSMDLREQLPQTVRDFVDPLDILVPVSNGRAS